MKENGLLLGLYNELYHKVTWPKWKKLQTSAMGVIVSIFILSIVLYFVDFLFIWLLGRIFSFEL